MGKASFGNSRFNLPKPPPRVTQPKPANTGKGANHLRPNAAAHGAHTTFRTDAHGRVTNYAEWRSNPQNLTGFDLVKRVDVTGRADRGIKTPHVHESKKITPGGVRPAQPNEIPTWGADTIW